MAKNKSNKKKQIEANAYVAASIPEDMLVTAYRHYRWVRSGACGEPPGFAKLPSALFPRKLPSALILQEFERPAAADSFEAWIRREIEATHKIVHNAVAVQPPLPGVDANLDKAFAECKKYNEDLKAARKIAKRVAMKVLTDDEKERLKAKAKKAEAKAKEARKQGRAEGFYEGARHADDNLRDKNKRLEAELEKRWRQWGKTRCEEWAKKRFLDLGNAKGPSEAISRLLDDKEFVETCKHFGFFGATDETPPTEAALKKRWTRHKKGTDPLDTPKVKKPKHPKAKKPERGFADDGVKPELPKERYRE